MILYLSSRAVRLTLRRSYLGVRVCLSVTGRLKWTELRNFLVTVPTPPFNARAVFLHMIRTFAIYSTHQLEYSIHTFN